MKRRFGEEGEEDCLGRSVGWRRRREGNTLYLLELPPFSIVYSQVTLELCYCCLCFCEKDGELLALCRQTVSFLWDRVCEENGCTMKNCFFIGQDARSYSYKNKN